MKTSIIASFAILIVLFAAARDARSADMTATFLVATRDMPDAMFRRTVILMIPSPQVPLVAGVIINQPTQVPLVKLYQDAARSKSETAFFGGPVETDTPSLILRAATPPEKSSSLIDDIYLTTDTDAIARLLKSRDGGEMRLILGRAQWLKEQLHSEIVAGAWYAVPAKSELVFSDPKSLWTTLVARGELMEARAPRPRAVAVRRAAAQVKSTRVERQKTSNDAKKFISGIYECLELRSVATPRGGLAGAIVNDVAAAIENRDRRGKCRDTSRRPSVARQARVGECQAWRRIRRADRGPG
ncbi:MAG: YqgE/AlgH family protein [Candidatus Binatus sp.]|nr:YqgE/AlgH family protein [Candidatus Binatus sp.]